MTRKITILFIVLFVSFQISEAQSKKMLRAERNYERFKYHKAIKLYEDLAAKGYKGGQDGNGAPVRL